MGFCGDASASLLTNSDFEAGGTGWVYESGASVTVTAGIGNGGTAGLALEVNGLNGYVKATPALQLVPGDVYKISVDVKNGDSLLGAIFRLGYYEAAPNFLATQFPTASYATYTDTFTAPNNPVSVFIYGAAAAAGTYSVDNFTLVDTSAAAPEPASLTVLACAAAGLLVRRRVRRS
jgi:hypothetical protein